MEVIFGACRAIVGGLAWSYCSPDCMSRCVKNVAHEMQKQVQDCSKCADHNRELLAVLDGQDPPMDSAHLTFNDGQEVTMPVANYLNGTMTDENGCPCPRTKPGKITNNTFFNYVREKRRTNCGKKPPRQLVHDAAVDWRKMTQEEKCRYTRSNVRKHNKTTTANKSK